MVTPLAVLDEDRTYPPVPGPWNVGPHEAARLRAWAAADPVAFWESAARRLEWARPWHTAHTWSPAVPDAAAPGGLELVGWVALDSQNKRTNVRLSGHRYGLAVSDNTFKYRDPRRASRR